MSSNGTTAWTDLKTDVNGTRVGQKNSYDDSLHEFYRAEAEVMIKNNDCGRKMVMTRKITNGTHKEKSTSVLIGEVSKVSTAHETIHLKYGISRKCKFTSIRRLL